MNESGDGKFRQLLANPWVGGTGLVLTSISIIVAVYFGVKLTAKRDLILAQEKPSILVFDPGLTDAFDLTPKSLLWSRPGMDPLSEKVHGVCFAIWNNGRVSIKPEHILKPLRIQIGDKAKQPIAIWEIRPTFWSREEIKMDTNGDVLEESGLPQIPTNFRILEQGDGASFQVIYSGPEDISVSLRGTVEGIPRDAFFPKMKLNWGVLSLVILLLSLALFAYLGLIWRRRKLLIGDISMIILMLVMAALIFFQQRSEITVLVEMPEFDYKPSIEDLRPE